MAKAGAAARAVDIADGLASAKNVTPGTCYNCACVLSLASAAQKNNDQPCERHAARAVALLRQAKEAGFFKAKANVEHLNKDSDLDPLRPRDDFKQFLAELAKP